jgi:methionyl-tRNA formyltransferase
MRLVFAGTPSFAVPALDALAAAGHDIACAYTQPDRPAGRGRQVAESPVKQRARALGIEVRQPLTLKDVDEQRALAALAPELMVVVAYGLILPQPVLDIPRQGCLNIHASLLPRWRGAAPIQRAMLAGDRETGVCIMRMEAGLDTGPVLACRATPIGAEESAGDLHDRLATLGAEALLETLPRLGEITPQVQDDALATYAAKFGKEEARLDWTQPAEALARQVRAFNPVPIAWCAYQGERLRVFRATALDWAHQALHGTLLTLAASGPVVATGHGALLLEEVQMPGGQRAGAADWARGQTPLRAGNFRFPA